VCSKHDIEHNEDVDYIIWYVDMMLIDELDVNVKIWWGMLIV